MRTFEEMIEKIAVAKQPSLVTNGEYTFDDVTDPKIKQELQLLQSIQKYNDTFAEEQLLALYRPMISGLVYRSQALKLVPIEVATQHAVNSIKGSFKAYKLDNYRSVQPNSYFYSNIKHELDKLYKANKSPSTIKMSSTLNEVNGTLAAAEKTLRLKLGREPSNAEVVNYAKNMGFNGEDINSKTLDRIRHYKTMEYSGSLSIGKENADGAEELSFEDVHNVSKSPEEMYNKKLKDDSIINDIRNFTQDKNKRRFLMQYLSLGEFRNATNRPKLSEMAIMNGISAYFGKKTIEEFKNYMHTNGKL